MNNRPFSEDPLPPLLIPASIPPGMALAIGPSGPPIAPPRHASAENFNPFHDLLGRFTTGDRASGPSGAGPTGQQPHLDYTGEPTRQKATGTPKRASAPVGYNNTIRGRSIDREQNNAVCVALALQTIIATERRQSIETAPKLEEIQAKVTAEFGRRNAENMAAAEKKNAQIKDPAKKEYPTQMSVDWAGGGVYSSEESYLTVMAKVLMQYGIDTAASLNKDPKQRLTPKQLADKLIDRGTPAMLSVGEDPTHQHAVTVQWDPQAGGDDKGMFLVNNLNVNGSTREFTKQQFESETLRVSAIGTRTGDFKRYSPSINLKYPVIYVERQ